MAMVSWMVLLVRGAADARTRVGEVVPILGVLSRRDVLDLSDYIGVMEQEPRPFVLPVLSS